MAAKAQQYAENGILISKSPIYEGDEITVIYSGLLAKSGADEVIIHIGYGESWDNKEYIPMEFDGEAFKVTLKVPITGTLNFAFKDSAENWDNNCTNNYSIKIAKKAVRAPKATEQKTVEKVTEKKSAAKGKTPIVKETSVQKTVTKTVSAKKPVKRTVKETEDNV